MNCTQNVLVPDVAALRGAGEAQRWATP